jgi:hypothetical protein
VKRFLLLLLIAAAARAGIEYARADGKALLMDLRGGPAIRQASRGYAVASIDYQLDADDQFDDAANAAIVDAFLDRTLKGLGPRRRAAAR